MLTGTADLARASSTEVALPTFAARLFGLGERFDRWLAGRRRWMPPPAEPVEVPVVRVDERVGPQSAGFDVLVELDLRNGQRAPDSPSGEPPRWALALSRYALGPGAPHGFWEAARGDDTLEIQVRDTSGRVLRRRVIGAQRLSWTLQRRMIHALAGPMLVDAVSDYLRGNRCTEPGVRPTPPVDARPMLGVPDSRAVLRVALRSLAELGRGLITRMRGGGRQWHVRVGRQQRGSWKLREFESLIPPPGRMWADPFPYYVSKDDGSRELVVFLEEMDFSVGRGTIVLLRRGADGWQATPVIEEPHHLSYPYLFEWQGEQYLVPESAEGGEITLYRMGSSLEQWHREPPLMTGVHAFDTSLLAHEGRIWMFTSIQREPDLRSHYQELHLFFADEFPTGEWTPHPANPVVCDARHARMGGGFLRHDGALYRVTQGAHCGEYGTSVELRRIVRLDATGYQEEPALSVRPDWTPVSDGIHHMAALDDVLVVDAWRRGRGW